MDATRPTEVPVPEPDLKPEEMIARARALRSMVREEAEAAERRGYYSEALHNEFVKAGFYRCLQPRRFGGYEFSIRTFFKTIVEIASGDPGIGWCLCLASGHALQIGSNFSEAAQAKIFGADGHFIAPYSPSGPSPDAECAAVPGGYRVKGKWRYASGVPYATHFMGMAPLKGSHPGGPKRKMVSIVVPRDQFEMLDDWHGMFGLKGSGSNSVVITDGFIPEDFVDETIFGDDGTGHMPGAKVHGNPMYNGIFMGFAPGELACSQVGAAWAALEEFEKHIRTTKPLLSAQAIFKYQHHDWQRIFGLALSMTHSAEAILLRSAELYVEYARGRTDGTGRFTGKEVTDGHAASGIADCVGGRIRSVSRLQHSEHPRWSADAALFSRLRNLPQQSGPSAGFCRDPHCPGLFRSSHAGFRFLTDLPRRPLAYQQ
jgi:3-hydroxy-9,10-secoandrosta-1,3,5(10)-triene-9,17-dione monooxygenase